MAKERLKSPRARLFVALDLPGEIKELLGEWQARELGDPALRPAATATLHMTLAFLGYRPEREIETIAEALRGLRSPAPEVRLEPEPLGVPRGRHPRLFAINAPSAGAVALQEEVSAALEAARLYKPEKRPFWPHLTVARVRNEKRGSRRPAVVEARPGPLPPELAEPFVAVRASLYRSVLRPRGAEYESLAMIELPRPRG